MNRRPNITRRNRGKLTKFRSKFEATISSDLEKRGIVPNYESLKIPYIQIKSYKPDFVIEKEGRQIIIEVKGIFDPEDRRKHLDIKKQHPTYDIRFVFYKDYTISKRSKTKYSEWCDKKGFKYSIKTIPEEWIKEIKTTKETVDV